MVRKAVFVFYPFKYVFYSLKIILKNTAIFLEVLKAANQFFCFRLVMPNSLEPIDVITPDPFSPEYHSSWVPVETLNEMNNDAFRKISE